MRHYSLERPSDPNNPNYNSIGTPKEFIAI